MNQYRKEGSAIAIALAATLVWTGVASAVPDFDTEVMPILTKAGCNTGACHGAAIGRGGFRLSLLGSDPALDYQRITQEFEGRRVNLVDPPRSLLVRKPTLALSHGGGKRLPRGSDGYAKIIQWLEAGAPRTQQRSLVSLHINPRIRHLRAPGESFQVRLKARYSDGSEEDVTRWVVFTPTDKDAVSCTAEGLVTAKRRGQSVLLVCFLDRVDCVTILVPYAASPVQARSRPRANFVDDHINRRLDELGLPQSPGADVPTLVRRLCLDLTGTLPDRAEVEELLAERPPGWYAQLVDRLLERAEYGDHWAYFWGDVLRIESKRLGKGGAALLHDWIRTQLRSNRRFDEIARDLILATGDASAQGPPNFHRIPANARQQAEQVSRVFLGIRLQCANCHNHPLDRWTQDDYHGFAAVFARIGRQRHVRLLPRGEVIHPKTGRPAVPRIPGGPAVENVSDPRLAVVAWMTSSDNPFFARAVVNRIWRQLMGRGLVEPVDDLRATNPATHPRLLDALAADFVAHGFDLKHTIRTIVSSEAYRRSSRAVPGNEADDRFYSRSLVRPLPPQVLVDAVSKVTGVAERFADLPPGTRAITLADSRVPSRPLDLLGRCPREKGCDAMPRSRWSLSLALHTINGPWLNAKIRNPNGTLAKALNRHQDDQPIIEMLYWTALSRPPSDRELAFWKQHLSAQNPDERRRKYEDFFWALLNSAEFTCNH